MPSTPTTKSQVQAYRFVLRRMQSALVRKDAVMLHDPMRTHSRATVVGVCIAAIGLIGFLIFGILKPAPKAPTSDGIVIGKPSGQVYVLLAEPDRKLVPVFNLASARLLLMAQQQDKQQQGGGGGGPAPKPLATANTTVVAPSVVDDNQLRDIPKGRKVGIADGPDLLPGPDQRIDSRWTVCDRYILDKGLNQSASEDKVETTVMAGVTDLGQQLQTNQSLLVRSADGKTYLVYRTPGTANLPNTSAVRAEVDLNRAEVRLGLRLESVKPRVISTGMLNAIPEKAEIKVPSIDGRGTDSEINLGNPDLEKTGSVFKVELAGEGVRYYVLLKTGIQPIKESTADIIRFYDDPSSDGEILTISPDKITNVPEIEEIDDSTYPVRPTEVLQQQNLQVACLGWSTTGSGENLDERTAVYVGTALPGVKLNQNGSPQYVDISTPNADGVRIDHFYMPAGRGAVVRQSTSKEDFNTGQITLISDRGVKYGVPDAATAAGLGLSGQVPAPENIIRLLPSGASLSVNDVKQSYDSTPFGPGQYPTTTPNSGGG
jgi:type VII secretion protein EccB